MAAQILYYLIFLQDTLLGTKPPPSEPPYSYELLAVALLNIKEILRIFQYSYELLAVALLNIKEILRTPYGRSPDFSIFLRAPCSRSPEYKRNPTNSLRSFSGFFNKDYSDSYFSHMQKGCLLYKILSHHNKSPQNHLGHSV